MGGLDGVRTMPGGRIGKVADVRYDVTFLTDQDIYLFNPKTAVTPE